MRRNSLIAIGLFFVSLLVLLISVQPGRSELANTAPPVTILSESGTNTISPAVGCAAQAVPRPPNSPSEIALVAAPLTLSRFRQDNPAVEAVAPVSPSARPSYTPKEVLALADPTNYGNRFLRDLQGRSALYRPIVVLHETVGSADSAVQFFQTPHPLDDDQTSYHTLIARDGTVIYIVPPDKRAFGAGDSVFQTADSIEAVQTNPNFPPSVNNFAYHISLETPPDGNNNGDAHSGYTTAQYQSLAWLVSKTGIPDERITSHKIVDRSGTRKDPRSFNAQTFLRLLDGYPKTNEIAIGCPTDTVSQ